MKLYFLLLVLALPYLSVCIRDLKGNMISPQFPPPTLLTPPVPLPFRPPPSILFPPPETLSFPPPPPLPLLPPPEPYIPVTVCSPPPPPVPPVSHCCVLVPTPSLSTPSFLQRFVASTFGRITIGVIISVVGYVFYRVCRRPRDPPSHQSRVPRRQSSHHSESSSASRTTDQLPPPPPSPPRCEQCFSVMTPGLRDFVSDGFATGM